MEEIKEKVIIYLAILILGFIAGSIITSNRNKYDLNGDNKVDIKDIVVLRNYILEHE